MEFITLSTAAGKSNQVSGAGATNCKAPTNNNNNNKEVTPTTAPAHFFRPIPFESTQPTPESNNGSEHGSNGGSETTIDSAFGSEGARATAGTQTHEGETASAGATAMEEAVEPVYSGGISVILQNKNLWKTFRKIGNEMIVTKPGRRLFPGLMLTITGLEQDMDYTLYLKVTPADDQRYRYINMKWCATGETEINQSEELQTYRHPSSPNSGHFWMKRPISFKSIKITHYPKSKYGNILLHTMHKYAMKLVIEPHQEGLNKTVILLPDTSFIAVSAYQNVELTQLKIDNNPFAKGFRYKKVPALRGGMMPLRPPPSSAPRCSNSDRPTMLAYWHHMQHMQQMQQMPGMIPQYNSILRMPVGIQPGASTSAENLEESSPTELHMSGPNGVPGPSPRDSPCPVHVQYPPGISPPHFPVFYQPHPFMAAPPPYQLPAPPKGEAITAFRMPVTVNPRFKIPLLDSTDTETEAEPAETESEEDMVDTEDTEDTEEEED